MEENQDNGENGKPITTILKKKELSRDSVPFVPTVPSTTTTTSTSTATQQATNSNSSNVLSSQDNNNNNNNNINLIKKHTLSPPQQNNNNNNVPLTIDNVKYLLSNRFHPKNNIREAVITTFNSLIYALQQQTYHHDGNGLLELVYQLIDILNNENNYIIKQQLKNNNNNSNNINNNNAITFIKRNDNTKNPPETLPLDTSDYQLVLLFNIHLLTKVTVQLNGVHLQLQQLQIQQQQQPYSIGDNVQKYLIHIYDELQHKDINTQFKLQILPTLLISLSKLARHIKFKSSLNHIIVNELQIKQQQQLHQHKLQQPIYDRSCIESTLYLLHSILSNQLVNQSASLLYSSNGGNHEHQQWDLVKSLINLITSTQHGKETNIQIRISKILLLIFTNYNNNNNNVMVDQQQIITRKLTSITLTKLIHFDPTINQSYFNLLPKLISHINLYSLKNLIQPSKIFLMKSNQNYIIPHFFKFVFDWLLGNSNVTNIIEKILEQFYQSRQYSLCNEKIEMEITTTQDLMWYWCMWECARFCIGNRLKTPYGSGVQTFEVFERVILQLNRDRKDFKKLKIMLMFMDMLEKQIFSTAYSSIVLPSPPSSKEMLFFKLNNRVSEDWFSRIRMNLLKSSILCSSTPDIVRHATQRITDIRASRFIDPSHYQFEMEFCILHLSNAYHQLSDIDSLIGLWNNIEQFNQSKHQPQHQIIEIPWMSGIINNTKQQYEDSLQSLVPLMKTIEPNSISFPFVVEQIIKSYLELSSHQELDQFLQANHAQLQGKIAYRENYLKSWSMFTKNDLDQCKEFVNDVQSRESSGGLLGNLLVIDELILATMINLKDPQGDKSKTLQLIDSSKSLLLQTLSVIDPTESPLTTTSIPFLHQSKLIDELQMINNYSSSVSPTSPNQSNSINLIKQQQQYQNYQHNSIGYLDKLRRIRNLQSSILHKPDLLFQNIPLTEYLIKMSRKYGNYRFSNRLLLTVLESHSQITFLEKIKLKFKTNQVNESIKDLIKYIFNQSNSSGEEDLETTNGFTNTFDQLPNNIKSKALIQLIKSVQSDSQNPVHHKLDIESLFTKSISFTPENVKLWELYGNWAFDQISNSSTTTAYNTYQNIALSSYFEYLNYSQMNGTTTTSSTIQITLNILNMITNHTITNQSLQEVVDKYLPTISIKPFMDIIPQLFAKLGHNDHNKYSQTQIVNLLIRISNHNPNRIIFPTIVQFEKINQQQLELQEQQQQQQSTPPSSTTSTTPTTSSNNEIDLTQQLLNNEYKKQNILNIKMELIKKYPVLVEETETLIKGLEAMTILWDDSWNQLMEQIHLWLCSHTKTWNLEYQNMKKSKVVNLNSKLKKKNLQLLQPVLDKIKKLISTTILDKCQTPHEKWFATLHYEMVNKVIRSIEKQTKPSNPFLILQELIQHFQMNRSNTLDLYSISPTLFKYSPTLIGIPGLVQNGDDYIRLHSIQPTIYLLPTKTKPKKISMIGSDGTCYSYLLKGREDLHLDERVMQMMTIIDQLLKSNQLKHQQNRPYSISPLRTRNYAVVPLSQSCGLIQWVESAIPLFSIYKNWYRNNNINQGNPVTPGGNSASSSSSALPSATPTPSNNVNINNNNPQDQQQQQQQQRISVRPVDIFYTKLIPLLNERNISKSHRSDWPKDLLCKVFMELVHETPKWLLSRELWYSSSSTNELFLKNQTFSRSLALMSMVGYVIGLGDRHLDNILLDLKTGEVVHIDFNICFEKGKQLKVPEMVPFRMTQMIEHALGLTGVQGIFTETSINVLQILKNNKQTLLNILETFIYDPLYDWKLRQDVIQQYQQQMLNQQQQQQQQMLNQQQQQQTQHNQPLKQSLQQIINTQLTEDNTSDNESSSGSDNEDDNNPVGGSSMATSNTTNQQNNQENNMEEQMEAGDAKQQMSIKNIQGLTIVNQVRSKLEGTELNLTVQAQVDMIIKESMSIDNLSVMYEGWTAWI